MENNDYKEFRIQLISGLAISLCWDILKSILDVLWEKKMTIAFTTNALVIFLVTIALTIIIIYVCNKIK